MAVEFHKEEERKNWQKVYSDPKEQKEFPFGRFESWTVAETKLLD